MERGRVGMEARRYIERQQPLPCSLLWDMQRRYFTTTGPAAWRDGAIPQYITSNPVIADAYARIVRGLVDDRIRLGTNDGPLTILELGSGSGQFAFQFLSSLARHRAESDGDPPRIRYVMTDLAPANLDFWRGNARLRRFFDAGLLDCALVDAGDSRTIAAAIGDAAGGVGAGPLVVIANYLLDGLPQDLFRVRDGEISRCLISLSVDANEDLDAAIPDDLRLDIDYVPLAAIDDEPSMLRSLLADYRDQLDDTHLLVPVAGLSCLDHLARAAPDGVVLLSADHGEHRIERLDRLGRPTFLRHGSISLPVNYHALIHHCERRGGIGLCPDQPHRLLDVVALLMTPQPIELVATQAAYRSAIGPFGPDDFFVTTHAIRRLLPEMACEEILSFLRLAHFDSHQLRVCLPRLTALAPTLSRPLAQEVRAATEAAWETHYPLGPACDLADEVARLLYALDDPAGALVFFERSQQLQGADTGTLYNIACCHHLLGRADKVQDTLTQVLRYDPGNGPARDLLAAAAGPEGVGVPGGPILGGRLQSESGE